MEARTIALTLGLMTSLAFTTTNVQAGSQDAKPDDMETIEVVGEVTLAGYKQQIANVKKDFFSLYNDLTKDGELKVKCRKERKYFSNVRSEVCTPVYESIIYVPRNSIADLMSGELDPITDIKLKKYQNKQIDELTSLVNSNEELRAKFFEYSSLLEKYQAKRASQKLVSNE